MRLGPQELLLILFFLPLYFVPLIVAAIRKSRAIGGIAAVNILLGWTFLGWVGALVWAVVSNSDHVGPAKSYASSPPQPRLCPECGKYSEPGAKYCPHCGAAFV